MSSLQVHFGHLAHTLHWRTDQAVTQALEAMELTASQGRLLGYLAMHADSPPCPRDIEAEFRLSHPTVSGLLTRLEQKGFLETRPDPVDRRCKRIYLMPKGEQCHERIHQIIAENELRMVSGFTQEEQAQFAAYLLRAIRNMGDFPQGHCPPCDGRKQSLKEERKE